MYLVLSLAHSRPDRLMWWGPDCCGYTTSMDYAGRFTAEAIASDQKRLNNWRTTIAVPIEVASRSDVNPAAFLSMVRSSCLVFAIPGGA